MQTCALDDQFSVEFHGGDSVELMLQHCTHVWEDGTLKLFTSRSGIMYLNSSPHAGNMETKLTAEHMNTTLWIA